MLHPGNITLACLMDGMVSTLLGESLKNLSGRSNKTNAEIWSETLISAGISGLLGKGCEKLSKGAAKSISSAFPRLKRLSGRGSAAVVTTGGAALVPLLTALGAAAGTAANISLAVAAIAVVSTIGAAALNIADTWGNIDNPIFNTLQSALNWTSTISNGLYDIGMLYSSIKYKFDGRFNRGSKGAGGTEYQYNMVENPGPLVDVDANAAGTFRSGKYNVNVLEENTVYYRAGDSKSPLGQYFTTEPPSSVADVRINSAVKPQWIDPKTGALTGTSTIDTVYGIEIPKGTITYSGPAGYQGGIYLGGKEQIFIPKPWNIDGVKVISSAPLK